MSDVPICEKCHRTPLDQAGTCVTCRAEEQGLRLLSRSGYQDVKETMYLLEEAGVAAEVEQVPPAAEREKIRPLWNLYVPADQLERAQQFLREELHRELPELDDPAARAALERGSREVDLDAGGEIECPACGHRFVATANQAECPDCGLSLGAPGEVSPEEIEEEQKAT